MAITTGVLRGGTNNHETTSEESNAIATDFVAEGIVGSVGNSSGVAPATGGFAVNASSGMDIAVSAGVAYVTGTPTSQNSQTLRVKNSATETATISANSSGSTKFDWVYIKLDPTNMADPNTAADNVATIVTSRSSSPSTDDGTPPTYGYPLAVVTVANGAVSITDGNIRDIRSQVALNTGTSNAVDGWTAAGEAWTVSSGYNKGNKEYDITISGDKTSKYSPGMRIKFSRGTTPPTQCVDLESSSSQYASRASASVSGITFTDDFTVEAWVKLESYTAGMIVSRQDASNGWNFQVTSSGQLAIVGTTGGANDFGTSYQSLPLNRWVHVAGSLDISGTSAVIYVDGVSIPVAYTNGAGSALTQAGNLQVGAANGATFFDGKIADVRVWNTVRTATQIRDNMNQQLVGNETNLVAYFKLDDNFNDSTSNANNLTGQNGAVATSSDNPMNATEYGIITKASYSAPNTTLTIFTGTDYNIPNLTLSTPYYSTHKAPFGFPNSPDKWSITTLIKVRYNTATSANTWVNPGSYQISVPTGSWNLSYAAYGIITSTAQTFLNFHMSLSTSASSESDGEFTAPSSVISLSQGQTDSYVTKGKPLTVASARTYYLIMMSISTSPTLYVGMNATTNINSASYIRATCGYL